MYLTTFYLQQRSLSIFHRSWWKNLIFQMEGYLQRLKVVLVWWKNECFSVRLDWYAQTINCCTSVLLSRHLPNELVWLLNYIAKTWNRYCSDLIEIDRLRSQIIKKTAWKQIYQNWGFFKRWMIKCYPRQQRLCLYSQRCKQISLYSNKYERWEKTSEPRGTKYMELVGQYWLPNDNINPPSTLIKGLTIIITTMER